MVEAGPLDRRSRAPSCAERWAARFGLAQVGYGCLTCASSPGALKGRRLASPTWEGLRPTSDKLRETLFNVLGAAHRRARACSTCLPAPARSGSKR